MISASTSFQTLSETMESAGALLGPAESHGMLCGLLCARADAEPGTWLVHTLGEQTGGEQTGGEQTLGEVRTGDVLAGECREQLLSVYQETAQQLAGESYELRLLLPDDDEPLGLRSQALGEWCQGFLFGLAVSGEQDWEKLSPEAAEIGHDLTEIAGVVGPEGEDPNWKDGEADEIAYAELVEYVRMGAMLIYEELQGGSGATDAPGVT
jgi:uncharacterized protein